ncbi:TPA: mandelate racemase/muconate lactonizing protein [Candidatus Poribacteria bacterium]|nr:mandelate racemase/muconate lactonizing protein [Candidatus Poribacteria bacterium]
MEGKMKITNIRFIRVKGTWEYNAPLAEERLVRPIDIYPEFRAQGTFWPVSPNEKSPYKVQLLFLFIDCDEGLSGVYGPISNEDAQIISSYFKGILIGENPSAVERIWDKMYRHAIHGRKGQTMMAISKIDLALWDLKGKMLNAPVYELLGGPSRDKIRVYASMLGYSIEPELARERAKEVAELGYTATKWFFRHDPTEGAEGMRKNLELIQTIRDAVGPDVDIMFDAWSSWDVPYTKRMAELAKDYNPWWFEEPVMADMIPQYAEIRRSVSGIAIAGGEHEYTRWGIKALLDAEAVDILQPDPTWAGGLTEMTKICALASSCGIPVIPHHGAMASTHLIASQTITTCPIQEWLIQIGNRDNFFMKHKIQPVNGYIELPKCVGLGMDFDEDVIESKEEVKF